MANYNWTNYPKQGGGGGDGGVTQLGTFDSMPPLPEGASISGTTLFMQGASELYPGLVSSASQTFAGVKTFLSSVILDSLTADLPLQLDGSKVIISAPINLEFQTVASISLENQVRGNLPLIQTSGSISLVNQVRDLLPILQTSGSVSLEDKVTGLLPILQTSGSVSLEDKVTGNLPLSQTSGSLSLLNQVRDLLPIDQTSGDLPLARTTGSLSLTDRVSGILPLSQTSGSISLANRVSGLLPANMIIGSVSASEIPPQSIAGDVSFVISNGSANAVMASSISGAKTFTTSLSTPQLTIGSVTVTSSQGGAAYNIVLPGAQGAANTSLLNDGSGRTYWGLAGAATQMSVVITSNTYVSAVNDFVLISVSSVTVQGTVFLPTAVGNSGRQVAVKRIDNYPFTRLVVSGTASQTIGTVGSFTVLNGNQSYLFSSDGTSWRVLADDKPTVRKTFTIFNRTQNASTAIRCPYFASSANFVINNITYNASSSASSFGSTTAFLTVANDTVSGTRFTINESGIYTLNFIANMSTGSDHLGWVRNIADGSVPITFQSVSAVLSMQSTAAGNLFQSAPWTGVLAAGDVIQILSDGSVAGNNPTMQRAYIEKLSDI